MVVFALACDAPLELPRVPVDTGVTVSSVEPPSGFAGDVIQVSGEGFGPDVRVSFGASVPVSPRALADGVLEVVVPDDASDGPVVVESRRGRGTSAATFDFRGLGRLRTGLVAATVSVAPVLERAWLVDDEVFVVEASRYGEAAWVDRGLPSPLGLAAVRTAALRPGASGFSAVVLDGDARDAPSGTRCAGHLSVVSGDEVTRRIPLHDDVPGCRPFAHVAVDASGRWALAGSRSGHAIADLDTGTVRRVDGFPWGQVAAVGDGRFVAAFSGGLAEVRLSGGTWSVGAVANVLERSFDSIVALDGRADGRVAMLTSNGRVSFLDAAAWPPTVVRRAGFTHHDARTGSIAFSDDGSSVAVVLDDRPSVSVWGLDGEARGAVTIAGPRGITASGGLFIVAHEGGWSAVSASRGVLVDGAAVQAGLTGTVRRSVQSSVTGRTQEMLEVVSSGFGRVLRLDPSTLQPVDGFDALVLPAGDPASWAGVVDERLLLLRGQELSAIGLGAGDSWMTLSVPFGANVLAQSVRGQGGTSLAFVEGYDTALETDVVVAVDFSAGLEAIRTRRVSVPLEAALFADGDAVVLAEAQRVRVFGRDAFLADGTTSAPRFERTWDDATLVTAMTARDALVVLLDGAAGQRLERAALPSGTWDRADDVSFPGGLHHVAALSPSGRHFWLVAGSDTCALHGWSLDGARPGAPDPALALSPRTRSALVFPDGEGIVLEDAAADVLTLVR